MEKTEILIEALPYIRRFHKKTVVIKLGGSVMEDQALKESMVLDIVLLKYVGVNPIVVHGGGKEITQLMNKLGKKVEFINGQRVTDAETLEIVEMVLAGKINKSLVALFNQQGGKAVGVSGTDGGLVTVRRLTSEGANLGFVGEVTSVNPRLLQLLTSEDFIPVISSLGVDEAGISYNINADDVAGEIAIALQAEKLVLLTDTPGIYDQHKKLFPSLNIEQITELIKQGVIQTGMLPKVEACCQALKRGVNKIHIIDGRVKHALLLEFFTDEGIGTEIVT